MMEETRGNRRIQMPTSQEVARGLLDSISQAKKQARAEAHENYCDQSRDRLRKNVETKIRTTMIGALSQVEAAFGFLWGHGKRKDQPLTKSEKDMADLYDKLRTEILNLGNNQIRAARAEIDQYRVDWQRYQYGSHVDEKDVDGRDKILPIFGLDKDGKPKKLRFGTNPDGSIKTSPEGQEENEQAPEDGIQD